MLMRLFALLSVFAGAALVGSAQQQQPPSPGSGAFGSKQRTYDVPTPGTLGRLRTEAAPRPSLGTTGVRVPVANAWEVDPATGAQYRRGEVLVQFTDGLPAPLRARSVQAARGRRIARVLPANWNLVELDQGVSAPDALRLLRVQPGVANASLNYRVRLYQFRPNDEHYGLQWNFDAISLPVAWQINPGATSDIIVAVIDTGLNILTDTIVFFTANLGQIPIRFAEVPDLVTSDRIVAPYDFIYDDELPVDLGGHGTHVAGTIAQQTNNNMGLAGVAYNVKLMPLKVISGGSFIISWDDILNPGNRGGSAAIISEAVRYAADNGAKVINMSLGSLGPMPSVRDAISYAVSRGAFVAIAAGNSGDEGNPVEYPAAYAQEIRGAMTVGAVNRSLRPTDYSGFHPYVEICAPGGERFAFFDFERGITQIGYNEDVTLSILAPIQKLDALLRGFRPRFDEFEPRPLSGTSMAAPHVAGVAALLYSQGIRNPGAIEDAIKRFARPIDASADECGAGLVDARRALRGLGLAR